MPYLISLAFITRMSPDVVHKSFRFPHRIECQLMLTKQFTLIGSESSCVVEFIIRQ